ncbi:SNF2-related protein [Bdellovibrionota bacterium FG-2]
MEILIGIASLAVIILVAWKKYGDTPLVTAIREATRNINEVEQCASDANMAIERATYQLHKKARSFVKAQQTSRLRAIPLEDLKGIGAVNIRLSALRQAGFTTLAQVVTTSEGRLMSIEGVGKTTAEKVMQAARSLAEKVRSEPPSFPSPDLTEPQDEELVAGTLHLLHAKELLEDLPNQLNAIVVKFRDRQKNMGHEAGFTNWIRHKQTFSEGTQSHAKAKAILIETREFIDSEALRLTRDRLIILKEEGKNRPPRPKILAEYHDRYASSTALMERFILSMRQADQTVYRRSEGGLPAEVAERTEKVTLESGALRVTLRKYQEFGTKYLIAQERTILGDEMGLGKTIEALAVMTHMSSTSEGSSHFLVVAPASLTRNWMREIEERTRLPSFLLHGPESDRRQEFESWVQHGGIAVTAYSMLAALPELVSAVPLRFLVVDEAHSVKNPAAQRTKLVRQLVATASRVCLMTGTPIENHPNEFVNLVDLIQPTLAHQLRDSLNSGEVITAVRFKERVATVYLRRNQRDVLTELPEKIEVPLWVDMTADDADAYRTAVFDRDFHRMRKIAILGAGIRPSSKVNQLVKIIDEHRAEGRKVLVFTFFRDVLDAIQNAVETIGVLHGDVPMAKRMALIDTFQQSKGYGVLACQINVGGVGLNLHAASAVILMEPQWKPSSEEQAIARAHRMGQTRSVLVHRLLTRNSVEERMLEILAKKSKYFAEYAQESSVKSASTEATDTQFVNSAIDAEIARLSRPTT